MIPHKTKNGSAVEFSFPGHALEALNGQKATSILPARENFKSVEFLLRIVENFSIPDQQLQQIAAALAKKNSSQVDYLLFSELFMPYGDLSTVRGCIEVYGGPIEKKLVSQHGYPNPEMRPFDFHTALEKAAFKCDDVATEVLLKELTSGEAMSTRRQESLLVIERVNRDLLEDCSVNSDAGKFGEILFLLRESLKTLQA